MRGQDQTSGKLFSYIDVDARVPAQHPLRIIRGIVNDVLFSLSPDFEDMYSRTGRPSIPPEQLLRHTKKSRITLGAEVRLHSGKIRRIGLEPPQNTLNGLRTAPIIRKTAPKPGR